MRFAVPLLLASSALASLSPSRILSSRQAVVKRDLIDVCAALDLDLQIDDPLTGKPLVLGHLDLCLCVSILPTFIQTNVIAKAAVLLLGEAKVIAQLESLIEGQSSKQQCKYPSHAQPACLKEKLCTFNCTDGFVPSPPAPAAPTACTCPPPMSICNGKCGDFPHGCGSQAPVAPARVRRTERCAADESVCGTGAGNGWECVKTVSDLFSCGGCMYASPFSKDTATSGVDCSAIPNVDAVSCRSSKCAVKSCKSGFVVSPTGDSCIPSASMSKRHGSPHVHPVAGRDIPIVGAVVGEGLDAVVPGVLGAAEGLGAGVVVGRDVPIVGAVVGEGLDAVVPGVLGAAEGLAAGVKVGRDIPVVGAVVGEGLDAVVPGVLGAAEGLAAGVKVGRDIPIVGAVVGEGLDAVVPGVLGVTEGLGAGVVVGRDIPIVGAVVGEGLDAVVPGVLGAAESLAAGVVVGRDIPIVGAVVGQGLDAVVPGVLGVTEGLAAGVKVGRDIPIVGAVVGEGLDAVVPGVLGVAEGLGAGAVVGRDIPIVGAVVDEALGVVVPGVAAVGEGAGVGAAVL